MSKPTSSYDSHPAVSERIRLIRSLQGHEAALHAGATDEPVSNLFSDIGALQQEMIALIQGQVNKGEDAEAQQRAAQYRQAAKGSVPEVAPCYERLAQAVERHDHEGEAAAWGALAEAYEERELYSSATNCWENAAGCYANLGDQESERVARYNMAQTLKDLQEWGRAEAELMKVVALDEATQSPDLEEDRVEQREVAQKWAAQATTPGHRGRHQVATDAAITEPK